ncbi:uncharacterized protein SPPG_05725 [Spizellomyces punctatus DAOM BR117]|uniref:Uncharacterized protein n=1 Tax=Spizellomyces punctatus (strain DAOM BR117) TaxID=645134 RepID=A0A0L0HAY7_SPIPD|nr:uncharacterized protein SPPG_05725 [Spizellomyces punctatus DAOM BR117]KNC98745.1 hypothetical protein SPPG_05725 [Spizellomyces punctatus DAOM BR117]|eukprot:XP_016606785.1 hypothetical protein SPPG_05725 [Spizellomyces punctatus DAOM BR117]
MPIPLDSILHIPSPPPTTSPHTWYLTHFRRIASTLLHHTTLQAHTTFFQILEIEFYLNDTHHTDPFTHAHPTQTVPSTWYFHQQGGSYRGGSWKGLDLVFGDGFHGGILIRAIKNMETNQVVNGPCKCVEAIMVACIGKIASVSELVGGLDGLHAERCALKCLVRDVHPLEFVIETPRIGLSLKPTHKNLDKRFRYISKPYRFVHPTHLKTKHLATNIVGLARMLHSDSDLLREDETVLQGVVRIAGVPLRNVCGCLEAYEMGLERGRPDLCVGGGQSARVLAGLFGNVDGFLRKDRELGVA